MSLPALREWFEQSQDATLLSVGVYDPRLVALSLAVAVFASAMALQLSAQAANTRRKDLRAIALLTGSLALGSGIWSMHFIGMLAFDLCTTVRYDRTLTVLSMLPGVAASYVALSLIARERIGHWSLIGGGVLVGAGIGTMHYAGMAAMRMSLALRYDPYQFALSIVVAVILAIVALSVRFGMASLSRRVGESTRLLCSAIVMGCAITGMHYTGMAAARFIGHADSAGSSDVSFLALAVTLITAAFTALVLGVNGLLRYRIAMKQLGANELRLRTVLATTVDGLITFDGDGRIKEFNPAAERIFGWRAAEIIGRPIGELVVDSFPSVEGGELKRFLAERATRNRSKARELLVRRKDGTTLPIRIALGLAHIDGEDLYVGFTTDISERKRAELDLQRFQAIVTSSEDAIISKSLTGVITSWNRGAERVFGYAAEEAIGQPMQMLLPQERADEEAAILSKILRGEAVNHVETAGRRKDGSLIDISATMSPILDAGGRIIGASMIARDVSERCRMERELVEAKERAEQAATARAAFLANMSHEIRTPMNSILGFTDVLLQTELSAAQRRHLDTVRSAGRSLLRLLNEVLDTAKLDRGAMELELDDFDLLGLIDELSSTLGANARAKGLVLNIRYDEQLPRRIHGDALRMRQVLTNLLGNAIKFTEAGSVSLQVEREDHNLHLRVVDTGIGIPADRLAAIFDPFTQADASMSRRYGGTGLGTTISKQLVELMGGRIWVESTLGQGSCFHVLMPLQAARQSAVQATRSHALTALPALRILAADDVPQNLELLGLLLGTMGHTVTTACNGAYAVRAAAEGDFDVILMDVHMPEVDGLEATRRIRAAEQQCGTPRVPVIALTASVLDADRRDARDAGMDGFASKPVELPALTREMARVLGLTMDEIESSSISAAAPAVLDADKGLRRWAGQLGVYQRALASFADTHLNAVQEIAALQRSGHRAALHTLAHRIKGAAANMGLDRLVAALAEIERSAGDTQTALDGPVFQQLPNTFAEALAAIAARLGDAADTAPGSDTAAAVDTTMRRALGERLLQSLSRGALDDITLTQFVASAAGQLSAARLDALQQAIDDFDFIRAQAQLQELLAALDQRYATELPEVP